MDLEFILCTLLMLSGKIKFKRKTKNKTFLYFYFSSTKILDDFVCFPALARVFDSYMFYISLNTTYIITEICSIFVLISRALPQRRSRWMLYIYS